MNIEKTKPDIKAVQALLQDPTSYDIDMAGYHVQQIIEKNLKYYLSNIYGEEEDTKKFKTHSLPLLYARCLEHGMKSTDFPEGFGDILESVTDWEAGARYGKETVAELEDVQDAFDIACQMFETIQQIEQKRQIYNAMEEKLAEFDLENYELQDDDIATAFAMLENGVYFDDAVNDALQCIYDKEYGTEKE